MDLDKKWNRRVTGCCAKPTNYTSIGVPVGRGTQALLYRPATSDRLPAVIQLRWKSHRQLFALIEAHQCGVLMVDVWMDGYYAKPTNYTNTGVPVITL